MTSRWVHQRKYAKPKVNRIDDWLMTYADMITLLLCFFVVFGTSAAIQQKKATKIDPPKVEAVLVKEPEAKTPLLPIEQQLVLLEERIKQNEAVEPMPLPDDPVINQQKTPEKPVKDVTAFAEPQENPQQPEIAAIVSPAKPDAPPPAGNRLTTLEISSSAMFDRASAIISEQGKDSLRKVAAQMKEAQYKDYQITVEGHTDDVPIATALYPSNWELSAARASSVVRFLIEEGLPAEKLRAAGYASTFPKLPNRDAKGEAIPENQAQNRRVVIKLEKIEKTP